MIHTRHGVNVRIVGVVDKNRVRVQDIDFPTWVRTYDLYSLRATDGITEIDAACKAAPMVDEDGKPR